MATSELDNIDPFEPDALDVAVDTYSEEVPLAAQIGIGMTPAGLAVDAAEMAKYGRDAFRSAESGEYGDAAIAGGLTALGAIGLIPVAGDLIKAGGKSLLKGIGKNLPSSSKVDQIKESQLITEVARQKQPAVSSPVTEPEIQELGGKKLFSEVESNFKVPQSDILNSDELVERAMKANPSFQKEIKDIADNLNLEKTPSTKKTETGEVINIEVKSKSSIQSKLNRKPYGASGITDTIRTRVYVNTAEEADAVAKQISDKFPSIDSKFQTHPANGFFDRKINVQHVNREDGRVILGEVSMTTKPMAEAVDKAHKLYEKERDLLKGRPKEELPMEVNRKVEALQQEQRAVYQRALRQSDPSIIEAMIPKFRKGGYVSGRFGRSMPMTPKSFSNSSSDSFVPSSQKSIICAPDAAVHDSSPQGRKNGLANSPDSAMTAGKFSQEKKYAMSINEYLLNPDGNANDVVYVNTD